MVSHGRCVQIVIFTQCLICYVNSDLLIEILCQLTPEQLRGEMNTSFATNETDMMATLYIVNTAHAINFLLSLPVNCYVVWLILNGAGSGVAVDIFYLSVSLNDIIYSLFSPMFLVLMKPPTSMNHISPGVFDFFTFLLGFIGTGRPLFLYCICVERYLAVVHPVLFLRFRPLRYRLTVASVMWLLTLISCTVNIVIGEALYEVCSFQLLFLLFVMSFCCLKVFMTLKKHRIVEGQREGGENIAKKKALYIILINVLYLMITYSPGLGMLVVVHIYPRTFVSFLWSLWFLLHVITALIHPLLYLRRAGKLSCIKGT